MAKNDQNKSELFNMHSASAVILLSKSLRYWGCSLNILLFFQYFAKIGQDKILIGIRPLQIRIV